MKIAITADCHLTDPKENPDRFQALQYICDRMAALRIHVLVIAGDLFQSENRHYAAFERLCCEEKNRQIRFVIIPGNHDAQLSPKLLSAENIEVIHETCVRMLSESLTPVLFVPYRKGKAMGDEIGTQQDRLRNERWVLIGHGDWVGGLSAPHPSEPGIYMPLTRSDLEVFKPARVVMGHVHKPADGEVMYPGSSCPLDIHETGPRRFLVLDLETLNTESIPVDTGTVYFDEILLALPVSDEARFIEEEIRTRIKSWNLTKDQRARVHVRVRVQGYTRDKELLVETVRKGFTGYAIYPNGECDFSDVYFSDDAERNEIVQRVSKALQKLGRPAGPLEPDLEEMMREALHTVYGE